MHPKTVVLFKDTRVYRGFDIYSDHYLLKTESLLKQARDLEAGLLKENNKHIE
jgi:hypothetical protein